MKLSKLNRKRMPTHGLRESMEIRLIYRRLSLPFTYILYHIGVTANMTSLLMLALCIVSAGLIVLGHPFVGILLWQVWLIFDSVDGELARLRNQSSSSGWFLDLIFENFCFPINFIAIGLFTELELIGFAIAFLWLVCITIRYNYLECLSATMYNDDEIRVKDTKPEKFLRYISYGEFKNPVGWLAIICAIVNRFDVFLWIMFAYLLIRMIFQIVSLYLSLWRVD